MRVLAQLARWRRMFWLAVAAATLMAGDALLLKYGLPLRTGVIETGASFSVSAGSFAAEAKAATFAAVLDSSGLPILVRARPDDGRYQVLVGPYVSTDEAERAQRKLAAWGLGESRLVVDDTMRARPQEASVFGGGPSGDSSVIMVAAAGMSSIVFEMNETPRQVEVRRTSATALDVEIGPTASQDDLESTIPEPLTLPDGVVLVRELSVRSGQSGSMHAHLLVPDGVENRLRLEGHRVYLDLAFPRAPWRVRRPTGSGGTAAHEEPAPQTTSVAAVAPDAYNEQLRDVAARFKEIEPFLVSAAGSPEPDVLAALGHSVDAVRESIQRMTAPADLEPYRQSMLSAVARASGALAPGFPDDRTAAVREAIALFDASSK